MKRLIWLKTDSGYNLHERSNISWGTMNISNEHMLTIYFRDKIISKTFSSHKTAVNVSQTVAEVLDIKNRFEVNDGVYNLPGSEWDIS